MSFIEWYRLNTLRLARWVNHMVDATLTSPSLAEMVGHHLDAAWNRMGTQFGSYRIYDSRETYLAVRILDAGGYSDDYYERGRALMSIGVNGALVSPIDEAALVKWFPHQAFRTCPQCQEAFQTWFDYYGHLYLDHFPGGPS